MGKIIKMSGSDIEAEVSKFRAAMMGTKVADGKFVYTASFKNDRKASLIFTEKAYLKMELLIDKWDKEIAWHGVAFRGADESKDEYYITDILVYPQEVTGATVTTDQEKYQMWLYKQEDSVFNNIRFQGHSHVRMAVTPSPTDESLYERLLDMLDDTMFYIFGIWNKNNARTIRIYDMKKNIFFDNEDVTVSIMEDGTGIQTFLEEATEMVTEKKYTNAYQNGNYGNYGAYGYNGQYGGYGSKPTTPVTPAPKSNGVQANPVKKKKKKRVDPSDTRIALCGQGVSNLDSEYDYDEEDPCRQFACT